MLVTILASGYGKLANVELAAVWEGDAFRATTIKETSP